ncbi:MAG: GTP-binding protein [bacterium]|nr:GTP-binding protein [bacterium]
MIPVCLVTGFLGSGKTTFLRRIIARHPNDKIVYLVNEFSPIDVDGHVLASETGDLVALPGGSVFCTCIVTEFINVLTNIPKRFASDDAPIHGVVIEASGIANPMVVQKMLRETRLDEVYELSMVVSIVDPETFPELVKMLPNVAAQVQASDTVIVNRVDLHNEETIGRAEAEVRAIRPDAQIVRATQCQVDLDLFGPPASRDLDGEYASCVDPNYARLSVHLKGVIDVDRLRALLDELGTDLYRMKGFARVVGRAGIDGRMAFLDYSSAGLAVRDAADPNEEPVLAFIVAGTAQNRGWAVIDRIKAGEIDANGPSP